MTMTPVRRAALTSYLRAVARSPYLPGRNDCALFAAGAVDAMAWVDYAAPYRGRYTTLAGGIRILRKDGFADHVALAAAHLREIDPSRAQAGDIAAVPGDGRLQALGVVQGEAVYVLTPGGIGLVSRMQIQRAFGV